MQSSRLLSLVFGYILAVDHHTVQHHRILLEII